MNYKNTVAKVIFYSGAIYALLIFSGGVFIGAKFQDIIYLEGLSWLVAMVIWMVGFASSLLFFGGAEIIELLDKQNVRAVHEESPKIRVDYQHINYKDL